MRVNTRTLLSATAIMLVLLIPSAAWAQHKHTPSGQKKAGMAGMSAEMAKMMKSPHHLLMMAHMKSMSGFARTLRDQAVKPGALDVDITERATRDHSKSESTSATTPVRPSHPTRTIQCARRILLTGCSFPAVRGRSES